VQKTPNRVSLDSMLMKVVSEEFIYPASLPSMTICVLMLRNGFALVGKSTPADPDNFDVELGKRFAKEDAIRQMWSLEAYLLREKMVSVKTPASIDDLEKLLQEGGDPNVTINPDGSVSPRDQYRP
jgi:hypothetical protein